MSTYKQNLETTRNLVDLFNRCLATSSFPSVFKLVAYITSLLKKSDLNSADLKSYRPIANLPVLLKLLERLCHSSASRLCQLNEAAT